MKKCKNNHPNYPKELGRCPICQKISSAKYYQINKDKIDQNNKNWKSSNKERLKEYRKEYRSENLEKITAYEKQYLEKNQETLKIKRKIYYNNNPDVFMKNRLRPYWEGLSSEEKVTKYNELLKAQNNKCSICLKEETASFKGKPRSLAIDHCHKTGKVRGLLCSKCNMAIGLLDDNLDVLNNIIRYLKVT